MPRKASGKQDEEDDHQDPDEQEPLAGGDAGKDAEKRTHLQDVKPLQLEGGDGGQTRTQARVEEPVVPIRLVDPLPTDLRSRLRKACEYFNVEKKLIPTILALWDMTPAYHNPEALLHFLARTHGIGGWEVANEIRNVVFGGPRPQVEQGGAWAGGYEGPRAAGGSSQPTTSTPYERFDRERESIMLQRERMRLERLERLQDREMELDVKKREMDLAPQQTGPSPEEVTERIGTLMVDSFKTGIESVKGSGTGSDAIMAQILGAYQATIERMLARNDGGSTEKLIQELANTRAEFLQKQGELQASMFRERLEESRNLSAKQIEMQQDLYKQQLDIAKSISDPRVAIDAKKIDAQVEVLKIREQKERETRDREAEHRHQREMVETQTADRLVGLVDRGIQTIADPIAKAFGDSMRSRAGMPPVHVAPPGVGQPAPVGALPLTGAQIQDQIAKIETHEREVNAVKQRLLQQLQQSQGQGTGP